MADLVIDVRDVAYGAIPDAIKLTDGTCSGTACSSPTANWSILDVGKAIKITKGYTNTAVFRGTIANVTDATHIVLSGTVSTTATADGQIIYGTDNTTALNAAFTAAEALIKDPDEKIAVWGPCGLDGGGYMFTSALTSDNLDLNFEAWLYSSIGIGTGDNTIPWALGNSHTRNLKMEVSGGRGPQWGNTGSHRLINEWMEIKGVGFNGQKGLTAQGYGFNLTGNITIERGSKGADWTGCQDIHGPGTQNGIGCNDPFIFSGCEDLQVNLVADTTTNSSAKIDACRNGVFNIVNFINDTNTAATVKIGSVSTTTNRAIKVTLLAQASGGKAVFVDYCDGGVEINITATNKPCNSGFHTDITHAVEYGSHLSGTLNINVARDSDIALYTGTLYGTITDRCSNKITFGAGLGISADSIAVTSNNTSLDTGFRQPAAGVMDMVGNGHTISVWEGLTGAGDWPQFTNAVSSPNTVPSAVVMQAKGGSSSIIFNIVPKGDNGFVQMNPGTAAGRALVVKGAASQTGNLMEFQNNSNSVLGFVDANGSLVCGSAALSTSATAGFIYMPSCAGTPTGTPTTHTGTVPFVYDTTNNKICVYNGGAWKKTVALT